MSEGVKPRMYRLINPDPLFEHTQEWIATVARCSMGTVNQLRSRRTEAVSEPIARRIAAACSQDFDTMFQDTGRRKYQRV